MRWPWQKKDKKKSKRSYAGATFNRLTADWIAASTSVDAEIRQSLKALRQRSRDLGRNNDYARAALRDIQVNVVGQGFNFQSHIKKQRGGALDDRLNDQVEALWHRWCKKRYCDVAGRLSFSDIERLAIRSVVESGEFYIRMITQSFGGSKVPFALEAIEADLLDDDHNGRSASGNEIRMGVEVDSWGRPVNYYFLRRHPGDYPFGSVEARNTKHIIVPAREIIPLFISERAGQTRGVPWFASAITRLRHMGGYEEAEIIAARATASLMGFIQTPEGELQGDDVADGQVVTEFEPGVFKQLNPGETVNVPDLGRPGGQFDPFMRIMLRGVAAGIGPAYESISADFSQSNYSSSRQALLGVRDYYRIIQVWMKENFHQIVFEHWLDMAVMSGAISLPRYEIAPEDYYESVKWQARGWQWIDPAKEVKANRDAVAAGFKTQADIIAEQGGDLNDLMTQRAKEIELAEKLGLKFETEPQSKNEVQPVEPEEDEDENEPVPARQS